MIFFFFLHWAGFEKRLENGTPIKELVEDPKISPYFIFYFNRTLSVRRLAWSRFDNYFPKPGRLAGVPVLYILLDGNVILIFILLVFKSTH